MAKKKTNQDIKQQITDDIDRHISDKLQVWLNDSMQTFTIADFNHEDASQHIIYSLLSAAVAGLQQLGCSRKTALYALTLIYDRYEEFNNDQSRT